MAQDVEQSVIKARRAKAAEIYERALNKIVKNYIDWAASSYRVLSPGELAVHLHNLAVDALRRAEKIR